jgi:dTDP-4-dehydrorhamnose 3,5-epimerase
LSSTTLARALPAVGGRVIRETGAAAIAGVRLWPLRVIEDARGAVLHIAPIRRRSRGSRAVFLGDQPGVVKAWKRHHRMTQAIAVPSGRVKVALFDDRPDSATQGAIAEYVLGRPDGYALLCIPPLVWYGWTCVSETPALLANCADLVTIHRIRHAASPGLAAYRW